MARILIQYLMLALSSVNTVSSLSGKFGQRRHMWEYRKDVEHRTSGLLNALQTDLSTLYPAYNFSTPVDHFHNDTRYEPHSNASFNMRYWFDASNYKPGGPVIIVQGGETDGAGRLPFLQKGILAQLAQASNGIGVVLEHRYYGESFPTSDLSTENLRFLSTEQALADEAYFAQHIKFPGLEQYGDISSNTTAYIAYGGSYAGSFSAFLRVVYPNIFWGAISSSGVTKAIYNYWHYFDAIAQYGPSGCIAAQKTLVHIVDTILIVKNHTDLPTQLKTAFGLPNVTYDSDFASLLTSGLQHFQAMNWDPAVDDSEFYSYCDNITSTEILFPATEPLRSNASRLITEGGYKATEHLVNQMLNLIGYLNLTVVTPCAAEGLTQDSCFSTHNETFYQQDNLDQYSWRSWPYQYCTEYGYLMTADVPAGQLPIISRTSDLDSNSLVCRLAFNITTPPNVEAVNKYGSYDISYPRLAMIGGEWDPWRPATPQGFEYGARNRTSTTSEPFILIPAAVHHWDQNGLFPNETTADLPPSRIIKAQATEVDFVLQWMKTWREEQLIDEAWDEPAVGMDPARNLGTNVNFRVQT